jgi:2-haloacid dehalogenase
MTTGISFSEPAMPRAFVFDAYGTLFDVHAAIGRHRAAAGPDADRFSEIWRGKQLEYTWTHTLAGRYVDFWTLTERALDFSFARVASVDKGLKPKLLDAYLTLDAFADARAVLGELKRRGETTAILSNGSPRMLAAAVEAARIGGDLDALLSVDTIRIYKPRPEVYAMVTERFKLTPADVVFVSSNRWDVMGAAAFGFRTAWVNRAKLPEEYGPAPDAVLADLSGLMAMA